MATNKKNRPVKKKTDELVEAINVAIAKKTYYFTDHATSRSKTRRNVSKFEVIRILKGKSKYHEAKKDTFSDEFNAWNYSVRGLSTDAEAVRIIVSFDEDDLLIITVINLDE